MRVLIAPTAFPGRLTAPQVADAIADGWSRTVPHDDLVRCPLSDGGPGFVDAVHRVRGGQLVIVTVDGPHGGRVPASVLMVEGAVDDGGGRTAYVEAAQACGLHLVDVDARDPVHATSGGIGGLLDAALAGGATRVVVGLGGLACHDAGAGLLAALGAGSPDRLGRGGGPLRDAPADVLAALPAARARFAGVRLVGAADTDVPLLGLHGASATYAAGRGASPQQAQDLEAALGHFAHLAQGTPGVQPTGATADGHGHDGHGHDSHSHDGHGHDGHGHGGGTAPRSWAAHPGAGAGGGVGFALLLLGAELTPGSRAGLDAAEFGRHVAEADLVVTGAGLFGWESLRASVVSEVAARSMEVGVPVVVVAGEVEVGRREMVSAGIEAAYAVHDHPSRAATALPGGTTTGAGAGAGAGADAAEALAARAARVARTWSRRP